MVLDITNCGKGCRGGNVCAGKMDGPIWKVGEKMGRNV